MSSLTVNSLPIELLKGSNHTTQCNHSPLPDTCSFWNKLLEALADSRGLISSGSGVHMDSPVNAKIFLNIEALTVGISKCSFLIVTVSKVKMFSTQLFSQLVQNYCSIMLANRMVYGKLITM